MFTWIRIGFSSAAVFAVLCVACAPAHTEEMLQNLGPVGPYEPILAPVGTKRVIAFYEPENENCAFQAVVWERDDFDAKTVSRIRLSLNAGQIAHIDGTYDTSLNLQCLHRTLTIVDNGEHIKFRPVKLGPAQ